MKNLKIILSSLILISFITGCETTGSISNPSEVPHTHIKEFEWKFDALNHWHECQECHEQLDVAPHDFAWTIGKEAAPGEQGYKVKICSKCGYVAERSYFDYNFDKITRYTAPSDYYLAKCLRNQLWMTQLDDDRLLTDLNIPGSVKSGSLYVRNIPYVKDSSLPNKNVVYKEPFTNDVLQELEGYAITQKLTIENQLKEGVRFFDLGIDASTGNLCHTIENTEACFECCSKDEETGELTPITLNSTLDSFENFLTENPKEVLLVYIENQNGLESAAKELIKTALKSRYSKKNASTDRPLYHYNQTTNGSFTITKVPYLKECRGQIIILSKYSDSIGLGAYLNIADSSRQEESIMGRNFLVGKQISQTNVDDRSFIKSYFETAGYVPSNINKHIERGQIISVPYVNIEEKRDPNTIASAIDYMVEQKLGVYTGWSLLYMMNFIGSREVWMGNFSDDFEWTRITYIARGASIDGQSSSLAEIGQHYVYEFKGRTFSAVNIEAHMDGYTFEGWYFDYTLKEKVPLDYVLRDNILVFAKFVEIS